jgi:hypothetical protein
MKQKVVVSLVLGMLLSLGMSGSLVAKSVSEGNFSYTAKDKEYYLTEAELAFIRPGLVVNVVDFTIPDDLQPVVEFTTTNEGGMPLDMDGVYTLGDINMRFMLTYIPEGETQKVSYTGGSYDRGGEYTTMAVGHYTYKFANVLPSDYDADATTTLTAVGTRDLRDFDLERYYDNVVMNFIPSGEGTPMPRDIVTTDTCNRCHDPLGEHGGRYQEVQVCQQCHNPGMVGRSGDPVPEYSFDQLIHTVHIDMGSEFPFAINDCQGCHTQASLVEIVDDQGRTVEVPRGVPTADFPLAAYPNPMPACDSSVGATTLSWKADGAVEVRLDAEDGKLFATGGAEGSATTGAWVKDGQTFFLIDKASGDMLQKLPIDTTALGCNTNQPGTFRGKAGALHTNWMTNPNRGACGSCHQNIDWETGEGHPGGDQANDDRCGNCHQPDTGVEWDRSVAGAHTQVYKSDQLDGLIIDIKGFEFAFQGGNVRVTFSLRGKNGPIDPNTLNRLYFTITGPNEDFDYYNQESLVGSSNLKPAGANWTYRFANPLPKDAEGSYTLGVEGRIPATLVDGSGEEFTINDQMQNPTVAFAVGDAALTQRRMVVDDEKCENCHSNLSLHGSNRHNATSYCQTCHRWDETDERVRLEGVPESIHFKYMVHKLHMGSELDRGYVVYGYRSSVHDYSHVEFPGDLRNCESCHVDDSYELPVPDVALPTYAPADYWDVLSPTASACMSCHDSLDVAAHVQANTSELGESCNLCHGSGAAFDVEKVHAR